MIVETWKTTYPTVAAVKDASIETVSAWLLHLPSAQTDVEHTVRRRLQARVNVHLAERHPEVYDSMQNIRDAMGKAGIKVPGNIYSPE